MKDRTAIEKKLREMGDAIHPVVPFNPETDRLLAFDFTGSSPELAGILTDIHVFTSWVNIRLEKAGARYGIGGYGEHRTVYSSSKVFDPEVPGEEPRRLHLGTDIWGRPHTAVMAPLNGIVHSFGFHNRMGDYGATIILSHALDNLHFYTLYGHLSLNSLKNLQEGERMEAGQVFAEFGIPSENGQWPPHLHFQLICDLRGYKGDYPGVCKFSEKGQWMANSPDPDCLLRLNRYL